MSAREREAIIAADQWGAFCGYNPIPHLPTAPHGPLAGLTWASKDVFAIRGTRTGFGSPEWLASHGPEPANAPNVDKFLAAGARLIAKTQLDEVVYSLFGVNQRYGTPLNPRAPDRVPGGSSSGSAVAVAAGLVDFATGTDCAGSVRIPASFCGIYGIRASKSAVEAEGSPPFAQSFDALGWCARSAEVLERAGDVLLGHLPAPRALPTRLLIADDALQLASPATRAPLAQAIERVAAHFEGVSHVSFADGRLVEWAEVFRVIQAYEIWANHGEWIRAVNPAFGAGIRERFALASTVSADAAAAARKRHVEIKAALHDLLGESSVMVLPTSPDVAPRLEAQSAELDDFRRRALRLLCAAGLGALPQVSIPAVEIGGLPLGLSLVGAPRSDRALLALARMLDAGRSASGA